MGRGRGPNVMSSVNTAQNRHLQPADGTAGLRIRLLGSIEVVNDGKPVPIASKKVRALLGYLAVRQGIEVSRGTLTGLLWGERSESQARASLRQALSELRGVLAGSARRPIIASSKEAIKWTSGSAWIDAKQLELAAGSEDDDQLRDAAELVKGELMEGLSVGEAGFEQWLTTERERFRSHACTVYSRLLDRSEQGGRWEAALTYGLELLALDPLQERVHRSLMRLYAAQGRYDAALAQYERCRRELEDQLGVSPEPETDDLARSIRKNRRGAPARSQVSSPRPELGQGRPIQSERPSIAVLPFINMSSDAEHEFFVDGLTEDVITALSRISNFLVIARNSTFTYKGRPTDAKLVAEELGVHYVMEGSVRRAGDRLRVTAQLIDAATGHQVWAERYDRPLADLFDIQDEITRSVVASTQTQVELAERYVAESRPSVNFKARDLVARANGRLYDQTPEAVAEASELVEEAIRIDPSNPTALRMRASVLLNRIWILHDITITARAFESAKFALQVAPRDEYAHLAMAWAWAYAAGRLEEAIAECEAGLEINPNCSLILGNLGYYLAALGRSQEAIQACRSALQVNPRDPSNFWRHHAIAMAHFTSGDYAAALQVSKRVARSRPHLPSAIIWAASAAALGNFDEARTAVEDCLANRPDLRVSSIVPAFMLRFGRDEDHERLLTLLTKAGLPI